ncbi:MAG: hypothetical protein NC935_05825 [Candidatus Omnitrophica bacterium]|nr:hypothetical protein [Candidatus Omnitrophota bacterium]
MKENEQTKKWLEKAEKEGYFKEPNLDKLDIRKDQTTGKMAIHFVIIGDTNAYYIPDEIIESVIAKDIFHFHLVQPGVYKYESAEATVTDISKPYVEETRNPLTNEVERCIVEEKFQEITIKGPNVAVVYKLYELIRKMNIKPLKK